MEPYRLQLPDQPTVPSSDGEYPRDIVAELIGLLGTDSVVAAVVLLIAFGLVMCLYLGKLDQNELEGK